MSLPVALLGVLLPDNMGRRWLRNALDAADSGLLPAETLKDLLLDLQAECAHVAPRGEGWNEALTNVCAGQSDRPGRAPRAYVLAGPTPAAHGHSAAEWTHLVAGEIWLTWHVDADKPSAKPWPSFPCGQDAAALVEFREFVQRKDWFVPSSDDAGAWMGRPADQGATCWVSTPELDTTVGAAPDETEGHSRQVGWALGLDHTPEHARVRYRIDARAVRAQRKSDGRRPTPADLPNGWFRTGASGARGTRFHQLGWGATAHLGSIHEHRADSDGRPEQVIASLAVDGGCVTQVDCLLAANDDHRFSDPHAAFEAALHGADDPAQVRAELQARVERLFSPERT